MNVIWKRPDGFHGAEPADFKIVEVGGKSRLWLHKNDTVWYPFRIAGGWQEQEATQRLNGFVNLIGKPMTHWVKELVRQFDHSMFDEANKFFDDMMVWLHSLKPVLKGDTWEVEIMAHALEEIEHRLLDAKSAFLQKSE